MTAKVNKVFVKPVENDAYGCVAAQAAEPYAVICHNEKPNEKRRNGLHSFDATGISYSSLGFGYIIFILMMSSSREFVILPYGHRSGMVDRDNSSSDSSVVSQWNTNSGENNSTSHSTKSDRKCIIRTESNLNKKSDPRIEAGCRHVTIECLRLI